VDAKERATKVRELTKNTLEYIDALKLRMLKQSGTDKVTDDVINDHSSKVATMMIDANSKDQEGKKYEKAIKRFRKTDH
jgi:hypothetical protein